MRFILPRKAEYTFSVTVEENGQEIITSEFSEPIKVDQIERNIVKNYPLIERGTPVESPTEKSESPGLEGSIVCSIVLLTAGIIKRKGLKNKKDGSEELHGYARR